MAVRLVCRFAQKLAFAEDKDNGSRIDMRVTKTGNNFWNTGASTLSAFGLRTSSQWQPKVKVAPFTRLNQTKKNMKMMEGFMSDSTAVNVGDPSSMRDQGQTRNAVYNGRIAFSESKSMQRLPYKSFLPRDGPQNQSFYSFGGKKMIREETEREGHLLNPRFRDYDGKVVARELIVYPKDKNQRVSDYTKNISQSIFSPGELSDYSFVNQQKAKLEWRDRMREQPRSQASARRNANTRSAQPNSRRKLDRFASKLNEEARKKEILREQLDEIKSVMSQAQASIARGNF